MKTRYGHLTYCTNIHAGETWPHHFDALQEHVPAIKSAVSPNAAFGIGLRLSHLASQELGAGDNLGKFKEWLRQNDCYVFTINGFPYGGFHHTRVKDQVHSPDWTTQDRVLYTLQLFRLLSALVPAGIDGGISTSPLSYKWWHGESPSEMKTVYESATQNIIKVVEELVRIEQATGQVLHLDIEPEPDGLLENGSEFIDWYQGYLLPIGITFLMSAFSFDETAAAKAIKNHVRLCYDICHFAVGYEDHQKMLAKLENLGIRVGKLQVSAALKAAMAPLPAERKEVVDMFQRFNESTYLHQVVALQDTTHLVRYRDLPDAIADAMNVTTREWRSHFHVPVFVSDFGMLKSTQDDIEQVIELQRKAQFTNHLEVETYTWEVLPDKLKLPIEESIIRELEWVKASLA